MKTLPAKVTRAVILTNAKDLFRAQVVGGEEILHFVQNDDDAFLSRLRLVPVVSLKGDLGGCYWKKADAICEVPVEPAEARRRNGKADALMMS